MKSVLITLASALAVTVAQQGWRIIASDIGGSPLGVAFFEDGLTGVTATSQIFPAGYEAKESLDGGKTWNNVPDANLLIFALFDSGVYSPGNGMGYAVVSGDIIQCSTDFGHNFTAANGAGGGEIVRHLLDPSGNPAGFAILGMTDSGDVNGLVTAWGGCSTWSNVNIGNLRPSHVATDATLFNSSWIVVAEEYITAASTSDGQSSRPRRRNLSHKWAWEGNRLVPRSGSDAAKAVYATQVVVSTDAGNSWTEVYYNNSWACLGIACIDPQHCCIATENADYAFMECTSDGFKTVQRTLADTNEGAALVEVAITPNTTAVLGYCYVAVGGYVTGAGQSPVWYRSCDAGQTWVHDPVPNLPVANLLVTDIDCQIRAPNASTGSACWVTMWDNSGIDPNGYVARYFPS